MSKQSDDKDEHLRSQPGTYIDPARKHARARKRPRPRRTVPRPQPSGPPSDPTQVMRAKGDKYPLPMKMGLMLLSIQSSVAQVAADFNLAEKTIYGWFEHAGGLNNVRAYAKAAAENSFVTLHREVCDEIRSRMHEATDAQLFSSYRKLMDTAEKVGFSEALPSGKGGGVSGVLPGGAQAPQIVLQFNSPTPLPPGPEAGAGPSPQPAQEDIVDGEVVADVFDE